MDVLFFFFSSIGVLLPELVVSIILLLTIDAGLMQETGSIPLLAGLLEHLDRFNHLAPGHEKDDNEDLAWPGIMGITPIVSFSLADLKLFIFLEAEISSCTHCVHCGLECKKPFFCCRIFLHRTKFQEQ